MKFDHTKPFELSDGTPARLLGVLNSGTQFPLVVAVTCLTGQSEFVVQFSLDGQCAKGHEVRRLINVVKKVKRWCVIYIDKDIHRRVIGVYVAKALAESLAADTNGFIAEIEFPEDAL